MIKTIFFDCDGTLVSHTSKSVPESTRYSLNRLKELKIDRVLATGRHMFELNDLPIKDIKFDAYISLNGQLCLDSSGNIFYANPLKNTDKLLNLFKTKEIPVMLVEKDELYINFISDDVIKAQSAISSPLPEVKEYSGNPIYQAIIYIDENKQSVYEKMLNEYRFTRWDNNAVDVVSIGSSKVNGIAEYLKLKGYKKDEAMAFGDGENDLEMLNYVNYGIAMGNSNKTVKEKSDYITTDIDEDGILNGLKYYNVL